MMSSIRKAALGAAVGLSVWAAAMPASAETVKIAFAGPMTGSVTQYGDMIRAGMMTAVEWVNANNVAGGHKFEIVLMDDACEPKQAVAVANRVVSDKIHYVVGHVCSGSTIPASEIYENEGVVMITPSATSPMLTDGKKRSMIFRVIGRDDQQGPAAAAYIIKAKPQKVAVLHDKQSYGQGIAALVKRDLEAAKIPVALFEGLNAGDSDYSALITKLKAASVDFAYFGGYHPEMSLLMRQAREQGLKTVFMGPEGVGNKEMVGAHVQGMLVTLPADYTKDPVNAAIAKAFADAKRNIDGPFQLGAYSAIKILAESMAATKSTDPVKVAAHMHKASFQTPNGKMEFTKDGDLKEYRFVVFEWNKDGSKVAKN